MTKMKHSHLKLNLLSDFFVGLHLLKYATAIFDPQYIL